MREWSYPYLNSVATTLLRSARAAYRGANLPEQPLVSLSETSCLWLTWAGTITQQTLVLAAQHLGMEGVDEKGIALLFRDPSHVVAERLHSGIRSVTEEQLVSQLEFPETHKFDCYLTQQLLRRSFAAGQLDLTGARAKVAALG
jgi:hypothetical protein